MKKRVCCCVSREINFYSNTVILRGKYTEASQYAKERRCFPCAQHDKPSWRKIVCLTLACHCSRLAMKIVALHALAVTRARTVLTASGRQQRGFS